MIHLERVNGDTIWDILKLTVADHQKNFVAGNDVSIIEAYIAITSNGYAFPFGIFEDDTPVGFVMIGYDKDEYWKDAPAIADGNYNLWRLMIDKAHQNKGYGRQAVELALRFIRVAGQIGQLAPMDEETADLFQKLAKKMMEQASVD